MLSKLNAKSFFLGKNFYLFLFAVVFSTVFFINTKVAHATSDPPSYTGQYWNLPEYGEGSCDIPSVFPTSTPTVTRQDNVVDFNWHTGSPTSTIQSDCFVARWTKTINVNAGVYVFSALVDDGVRVYVDDNLIIDQWGDHDSEEFSQKITLASGSHTVRVEYFEHYDNARINFSYRAMFADHGTWGTNDDVNAMTTGDDGTIYIGGSFSYVGPNTGQGVPLNKTTGVPTPNFPQIYNGTVYASVPDGSGGGTLVEISGQ
jgi:ubiquitin-protein ligase